MEKTFSSQHNSTQARIGMRVEHFSEDEWWPGVITAVHNNGSLSVAYDDGLKVYNQVLNGTLRLVSDKKGASFAAGSTVEVAMSDGSFLAAVITHHYKSKNVYDVQYIMRRSVPFEYNVPASCLRPLIVPTTPSTHIEELPTSSARLSRGSRTSQSSSILEQENQQKSEAIKSQPLRNGSSVEVCYHVNNKWFSGTIERVYKDGHCSIMFDNGQTAADVSRDRIRVLDDTRSNSLFHVGATVEVFNAATRTWYTRMGTIMYASTRQPLTFDVALGPNVEYDVPQKHLRVIHREGQDAPSTADKPASNSSNVNSLGVSLDNLSMSLSVDRSMSAVRETSYLNNNYSSFGREKGSSTATSMLDQQSSSMSNSGFKSSSSASLVGSPSDERLSASKRDSYRASDYETLSQSSLAKLQKVADEVMRTTAYTQADITSLLQNQAQHVLHKLDPSRLTSLLDSEYGDRRLSWSRSSTSGEISKGNERAADLKQLRTTSCSKLDTAPPSVFRDALNITGPFTTAVAPQPEFRETQQLEVISFANMHALYDSEKRRVNDARRTLVASMGYAVEDVDAMLKTLSFSELYGCDMSHFVEALSAAADMPSPLLQPVEDKLTSTSTLHAPIFTLPSSSVRYTSATTDPPSPVSSSYLSSDAFQYLSSYRKSTLRDLALAVSGSTRHSEQDIIAVMNTLDVTELIELTKYRLADLMDRRSVEDSKAKDDRNSVTPSSPRDAAKLDTLMPTPTMPVQAPAASRASSKAPSTGDVPMPHYIEAHCTCMMNRLLRRGLATEDDILAVYEELEGTVAGLRELGELDDQTLLLLISSKHDVEKVDSGTASVAPVETRDVKLVTGHSPVTSELVMSTNKDVETVASVLPSNGRPQDPHTTSLNRVNTLLVPDHVPFAKITVATKHVEVHCPEFNTTVVCSLFEKDTFAAFRRHLCDIVGYTTQFRVEQAVQGSQYDRAGLSDGIVITKVDPDGWSVEVSDDAVAHPAESVHYSTLGEGDRVEVRRFGVAFVGGKHRLASIAAGEKYNKELQSKVQQLQRDYTGYRRIRGDGNCYYRSVIYGLLEFIIVSGSRAMLDKVIRLFNALSFAEDILAELRHRELLRCLRDARDNRRWRSLEEFTSDLLREDTHIDESLIRACKKVVADTLISKQHVEYNDMTIRDAITLTYEDISSVAEFCDKYVLAMEVCAEGIHVNLGLLPTALGCDCNIVILPRDRNQRISVVDSRCSGSEEGDGLSNICTLNLLLRPGHYDLLNTEDLSGKLPDHTVPITKETSTSIPTPTPAPPPASPATIVGGGNNSSSITKSSSSDLVDRRDKRSASVPPRVQRAAPTSSHLHSSRTTFSSDDSAVDRFGVNRTRESSQPPAISDRHQGQVESSSAPSTKSSTRSRSSSVAPNDSRQSVPARPPIAAATATTQNTTDIDQLMECLSVSPQVAARLLETYASVEESVAHYFGMSSAQQLALTASPQRHEQGAGQTTAGKQKRNSSSQMATALSSNNGSSNKRGSSS